MYIYILFFGLHLLLENICSCFFNQDETARFLSYVINAVIIHHFRSSLFSFRIAIFWENVPFPDMLIVNFLMHGTAIFQEPCPVSNEWTMQCLG